MEPDSSAMVEVEGVQIVCRTIGKSPPLLVLNGFAATSADWDPCFIDQLASRHKLILLNNRGIGGSTDDGQSFDIAKLANDAAHVIETLGFERTSVMGWSMGGFIAQALAVEYPDRVHKLILLSTDSGGTGADLASPAVWSRLIDTSGTPHQQARRLLSLLFPSGVAESFSRFRRYHSSGASAVIFCALEAPGCGDGRVASQWRREPIAKDPRTGAHRYRH